MKKSIAFVLLASLGIGFAAQPASAASKETIQMMQQLDTLTQMVQSLQRTVDTQTAVLKTLVEQANDNVNTMKVTIADMQKVYQQNLASQASRFDNMTSQIQELSANLDEVKAKLAKISDQVAQTEKTLETVNSPQSAATGHDTGTATPSQPAIPPDPESLYQSARGYYEGGQYQLAAQAFQQYLDTYPDGNYASNAQYYIGDSYYAQKDYNKAIEEYNTCIEKYPKGNKLAAAQLKKGYALLALDKRQAGIRELRSLIKRFPKSPEAKLAQQRIGDLQRD